MAKKKVLQPIIKESYEVRQETLDRHNAFEAQTGEKFIGYIGNDPTGRIFNDIYKNGVHHGKIYGRSVEEVKLEASGLFGEL
jgi:hypothetical protein